MAEDIAAATFDKITHAKRRAFLRAYARLGTVTHAAHAAGVSRASHHVWWRRSAEYRQAFQQAQEMAADRLEREAMRRAHDGVVRMKFHEGKPIMIPLKDAQGNLRLGMDGQPMSVPYIEHQYSDVLLIFLLKGLRPEKYRERYDYRMEAKIDVQQRVEYLASGLAELDRLLRGPGEGESGGNGRPRRIAGLGGNGREGAK